MLKYVAIIQATHNSTSGLDPEQLKRVTRLVHKSPVQDTREQAENWIEVTMKVYPQKYYIVRHCIISFDEKEKEQVEDVLSSLIRMF